MIRCKTPEQSLLAASLSRFAQSDSLKPARLWDEQERFCAEAMPDLAEMGVLGATVPVEYGGAGLGAYEFALIVAHLARADGSLALTVASHVGLCSTHILRAGSEAQKARWLPPLASGEFMGAWGLTEPASGSDAVAMETVAVPLADGSGWRLNGSKTFITQGTVAEAYVILAVTDREKRSRGVTAFILTPDMPGFSRSPLKGKHGMRGSDTATLHFDDIVVPEMQRLGEVGEGFIDTLQVLDRGRIAIAALALGLAWGALDAAMLYAEQRRQFQKPLADFQAIQFKLATMATELEASRLLVEEAARLCDEGESFGKQASMAKLFASESAVRICAEALQIHGGYGYTNDFVVERHLRDARLCLIGEGTSEVQRMVIARALRREHAHA